MTVSKHVRGETSQTCTKANEANLIVDVRVGAGRTDRFTFNVDEEVVALQLLGYQLIEEIVAVVIEEHSRHPDLNGVARLRQRAICVACASHDFNGPRWKIEIAVTQSQSLTDAESAVVERGHDQAISWRVAGFDHLVELVEGDRLGH